MAHPQYILNRLPIGMITLDCDHRVTGFSGLAASVFGEEALGKAVGTRIHDTHPPEAREKIEWLLRQAQGEGSSAVASMLINMPTKVLQLRMVLLRDGQGVSGYCLVFYDITDLAAEPRGKGDGTPAEQALVRLPVSSGGRIALMEVDQVAFLQAEGHYTQVFSGGKSYFCNLSLSQLEARLPSDRFTRVHRSYLINLGRALSVQYRDDQYLIAMEGEPEREVPVGRSHVQRLRNLLGF